MQKRESLQRVRQMANANHSEAHTEKESVAERKEKKYSTIKQKKETKDIKF